jgi:hypothetical protein
MRRKKTTTTAKRRRTTPAKKTVTRRRKTTTKKRGLGDLFTRSEAQAGFEQLVGVAAGYVIGDYAGKFLNPNADKDKIEIFTKLAAGFLISTTGRMPSVGAGIMANGVKKMLEVNKGLADNMLLSNMPGKQVQYLADRPMIEKTNYVLAENGEIFLNDYTAAYQSMNY